jgi:hypothetical protein
MLCSTLTKYNMISIKPNPPCEGGTKRQVFHRELLINSILFWKGAHMKIITIGCGIGCRIPSLGRLCSVIESHFLP